MMNDKLKAMYAGGGLLEALLKDPKQREMAKGMLMKAEKGMAVKSYRDGNPERDKMILKEIGDTDKAFVQRGMKDFYYTRPGVSPTGYGTPTMDQTIEVTGYNKPGGASREEVEAYVKEQIQAKQRRDMGIDEIPTYGAGGKPMKYRMGGNMPGEDEDVLTEMDYDRIQESKSGNFEYAGQEFLEQRAEDIEDAGKLLRFFAVKEAARMLDEEGISPRGMRPEKILGAARQKGLNPMTAAKDLFDREIDRRRM